MSAVDKTRRSIQAYKAKVQSGAADPVEYQAIEENLQKLEQELNLLKIGKRKEIDVTDSNSILAFVGNVITKDSAKRLSDQIRKEYLNSFAEGLQLRPPTWSEELEYYVGNDTVQPETRSAAVRNLAAISMFGGGNEAQWRAFEHPWIMAIKSKTVKEEDLKAILFLRLKDSAVTYYLSITNVQYMSFGKVMQKL